MESLYDVDGSDRVLMNYPPDGAATSAHGNQEFWMCFGLWPERPEHHHAEGPANNHPQQPTSCSAEHSAEVQHQQHASRPQAISVSSFRHAGRAMAIRVGDLAQLQPQDRVLEVGCGAGDALHVWMHHFRVRQSVGLEIVRSQQQLAAVRVARWEEQMQMGSAHDAAVTSAGVKAIAAPSSLTNQHNTSTNTSTCANNTAMQAATTSTGSRPPPRHAVHLGSATAIPLPDACMDAVLAIDCAYHFPTRADFLQEAIRVLRPQGRLAMIEAVWDLTHLSRVAAACARKALTAAAHVPLQNQGPVSHLENSLQHAGFVVTHVQAITQRVVPGFVQFVQAASTGLLVPDPGPAVAHVPHDCQTDGTDRSAWQGDQQPGHACIESQLKLSWRLRLRWLRFRMLAAFLSKAVAWKLLHFVEVVAVKGKVINES